jgi:hypothetical protein
MKNFIVLRERAPKESGVIEKKRKDFFAAKGFLTVDEGK